MALDPKKAQLILEDVDNKTHQPSNVHHPGISKEELDTGDWISAKYLGSILGKNGFDSVVADATLREDRDASAPFAPETIAMINKEIGETGVAKRVAFADIHHMNDKMRIERVGRPYVQVDLKKLQEIVVRKSGQTVV